MLDKEETKILLERILESNIFKESQIYKGLLQYLVESNLSENIPKEITIAIDIFGKDSTFNSNKDSTVRYHMHMLRKKLEEYYKDEGKSDKCRVVIPKGHYEIKFLPSKSKKFDKYHNIITSLKRTEILLIILLLVINLLLAYWIIHINQSKPALQRENFASSDDSIWSSFFNNGNPVSLVLGDDFLLDENCPDYERYRQVRDWEIDSENDLSDFLHKYPDAKLWKSEFTLVPFGGTNNLMDILPIVLYYQSDVSLKMSSEITLEEIRNQNIIYMGEFKNLRILSQIIQKTPIRFQYKPDERLFIISENNDTLHTFLRIEAPYEQQDKYNVDYSLLIKMPGFSDENFMFIVGFGYSGRLERTKMLANPEMQVDFINEVKKINVNFPNYFIAVFEVKSIERTGFTNELKYFKEIPSGFLAKVF